MGAVCWIFRGCDNVGDDNPSTGRTSYRRRVWKQLREPTTDKKHGKITVLESRIGSKYLTARLLFWIQKSLWLHKESLMGLSANPEGSENERMVCQGG